MPYTDLPVRASRSGMARRSPNNPDSERSSRVHLDDEPSPAPITEAVLREYTQESPPSSSRESPRPPITPPRPVHSSQPDWHVPDYASPVSRQRREGLPQPARAVSPLSRGQEGYRESDATDATLFDRGSVQNGAKKNTKSSFSSYRHPYDIRPPNETYGTTKFSLRPRPTAGSPPPFYNQDDVSEDEDREDEGREDEDRGTRSVIWAIEKIGSVVISPTSSNCMLMRTRRTGARTALLNGAWTRRVQGSCIASTVTTPWTRTLPALRGRI
ncbi:hypothetical protein C8Q74DRAFT_827687 [Fomes fomentarius]|nr:hypothetical protein C8Q74DRAFT_827687 [Fomes fomentarius]